MIKLIFGDSTEVFPAIKMQRVKPKSIGSEVINPSVSEQQQQRKKPDEKSVKELYNLSGRVFDDPNNPLNDKIKYFISDGGNPYKDYDEFDEDFRHFDNQKEYELVRDKLKKLYDEKHKKNDTNFSSICKSI